MKVFISWSGDRSKKIAELLHDWLKCVIQATKPWISSKDIDRGSLWLLELTDQLKETSIGIICLTQENKNKPWILFEAGALAKGLTINRVCTLLIDLKPEDIENPLTQFNHTLPDKTGMLSLIKTINSTLKDQSLDERILEEVFDTYWIKFEKGLQRVIQETPLREDIEPRSEENILLEVLRTTRSLEKRVRSMEVSNRERGRLHPHLIKEQIQQLTELGVSENEILNRLSNHGVPLDFVLKHISECKNKTKELSEE